MQEIDVERIMEEIRSEIKREEYSESILSFKEAGLKKLRRNEGKFNEEEFYRESVFLREHCSNPIIFPIHRKGIVGTVQRIMQRLFRFMIFQGFQYQNQFNMSAVNYLNQVECYMRETNSKIQELEKEIEDLKRTSK